MQTPAAVPAQRKSPTVAFILGLLLPGGGFMYLGKWKAGFAFLGGAVAFGILTGLIDLPEAIARGGSIGVAMASAMGARAEAKRLALDLR
jgi:hypothetical protein